MPTLHRRRDAVVDQARTAHGLLNSPRGQLRGEVPRRSSVRAAAVRIILSHAGGFLPYAALRFAELAQVFQPDAPSPDAILASLRRFYFDTALSSGPALPTLKAFAGLGHILFGTDSPYDHDVSVAFTATLDADDSEAGTPPPSSSGVSCCGWKPAGRSPAAPGSARSLETCGS
jgi:Amidohydrolase